MKMLDNKCMQLVATTGLNIRKRATVCFDIRKPILSQTKIGAFL